MDKTVLATLMSLAYPMGSFRSDLVRGGCPEDEATKITLEVFGFRKYKQESESPIPGVTVKH